MVTKVLEGRGREKDFKSTVERQFRPIADKNWGLSLLFWPKCTRQAVSNHETKKI